MALEKDILRSEKHERSWNGTSGECRKSAKQSLMCYKQQQAPISMVEEVMEEMMKKRKTGIVIISMIQLIGILTGYKNHLNQRIAPTMIPNDTIMKSNTLPLKEVWNHSTWTRSGQ